MKVTGFQTWVVRVPYEENRAGTHVVLALDTDGGEQGIAYLTLLVPWTVKPVRAAVEALAETVVGEDPMAVEAINARFITRLTRPQFDGLARSAASVIDIALWDLKAKAASQPLWRMLGGSDGAVQAYASWNLWFQYDMETLAQHAREHLDAGFRAMKFRLGGVKTAEESLARTRILRETVGPDVDLHVDMNWQWTVNKTIRIGREMEQYGLFWIEDPIPANDYDGLAQISEALQTPVCTAETYHEPAQFRALLDRRAADVTMIDLEVGGITRWRQIASLVEGYGVPVASHMCPEVSAHLVAATPNAVTCEYMPWAKPLFKETPPVRDGKIMLSERLGLGLELDAAALKRFELS